MKTIIIQKPGTVVFGEIDKPVRKKGEALLRILYGGICGSDLGSYRGTFAYFSYPRTPGHEFSAEIVDIDKNEYGLEKGMIVTCNPYFNCGKCYSCQRGLVNACMDNQTMGVQREGAFSEYITMPLERIYYGKGIAPKTLAVIEPFCIGYHGVRKAKIKKGEKVLIIGAGTIGVMAALSAKMAGAQVYMSDVSEAKLDHARHFGIDGTILNDSSDHLNEAVAAITGSAVFGNTRVANGFDVAIEAVGLPSTFQNCIDSAAFGGRVIQIGVGKKSLDFNFTLLQKKELQVYGSRNAVKQDFLDLIDLVSQGKAPLGEVITDTYPFSEAPQAFADFDRSREMLKVIIDFTQLSDKKEVM